MQIQTWLLRLIQEQFVNPLFMNSSFPKYNIHLGYLFKTTTKTRAKQYPESVVGALDN